MQGQAPPVGSTIGEAYRLLRFLGAGGMGAVYEAEGPAGRVAVKVLLHDAIRTGGEEVLERFRREIEVTRALDHPNVVSNVDGGVDEALGLPFMVMPLMVGLDLEQHVEDHGPLHPIVAVRLIRQACRGVAAAHEQGVIHRDIKGANIFLDHDAAGRVTARVLDFGIAKWRHASAELTRTDTTFGTPHYMSPEQVQSVKHAGPRADLWSLAITLYQALTGDVPFADKESITELMMAIVGESPRSVQDGAPWVDAGLARIIHGALVLAPQQRCPSVAAWADALAPYAIGSDDVNAAMLVPLQPAVRAQRGMRTSLPAAWSEVTGPRPGELSDTNVQEGASVISLKPDPLIGRTLGGRFALLRVLGSGGMGTVYEATDPNDARVAVKVLDPRRAGSDEARKRFVREAQTAASITHDNVVRVFEARTDEETGLPFIAMELLVGHDLGELIERHGALAPKPVVDVFRQACRGLAAAHARGLVHRDIKPANLFLHQLPSGEIVTKICDFGLAKELVNDGQDESATNLTRTGGVMGSPAYMSPEQAKSAKHVDHRSDVWSLGASLYQALTGTSMWQGKETVGEMIVAICTEPVPHIQDHAPWLPPRLADAVHVAVARSVIDRFARVEVLEAALSRFGSPDGRLDASMLRPVETSTRGRRAQRAQTVQATSLGGTNVTSTGDTPTRRPIGLMIAAGVAITALAGFGILHQAGGADVDSARSAPTNDAPVPTASATSAPRAEEPPMLSAPVTIEPSSAEVTVDGEHRDIESGTLSVAGAPGAQLRVTVRDGDRELTTTVVITKEGTASPDTISLPQPAAQRPKPRAAPRAPAVKAHAQPGPKPQNGVQADDAWR